MPPPARHGGDRDLRRLLVHEEPNPGSSRSKSRNHATAPTRAHALERDHGCVTAPPTPRLVAPERGVLGGAARAPVERVAQHVLQEPDVLPVPAPNHPGAAERLAGGCRRGRRRPGASPRCGAPSTVQLTSSERNRSASAFASSTSIVATPASSAPPRRARSCGTPRSESSPAPSTSRCISVNPSLPV